MSFVLKVDRNLDMMHPVQELLAIAKGEFYEAWVAAHAVNDLNITSKTLMPGHMMCISTIIARSFQAI